MCLVVKALKRCNHVEKHANKKIEIIINHLKLALIESVAMPAAPDLADVESHGLIGNDEENSRDLGCFDTLNCEEEVG